MAVTRIHTLSHDCSHLIGLPRFRVVIRQLVYARIFPLFPPPQYFTRMRATHVAGLQYDSTVGVVSRVAWARGKARAGG